MTQLIEIHPENPQPRLVSQIVAIIRNGGVVVYPTDSGYALGCHIGDKKALDRIRQIRDLEKNHNFTLVCRDLSELAFYARVDNTAFRLIKNNTPGPYTFILRATAEVPNRLKHPKKKTIGIRVPDNAIAQAILEALGEPMMNTSLILPDQDEGSVLAPHEIFDELDGRVDAVIDGGYCGHEETTVVDMTSGYPEIIRYGAGDAGVFE
ncbi:threonylcarbamoyl-AMP synthase [Kangiella profundi]|uniref:Threonylcarbamoyl-AMP synthase n=1 Tax=Kangiella profundi TaxID=1561924 RepID=A0A2K9AHN5_9GAMM|nr:L-threonylcarbamoyladenylate synthase [Kangiella profundi]AUD78464.1 threonylcarbamoyl-AMP synthase [Kangiella profundi]MBD3667399.1 threonylcarbamoyl-AMP synthase [Kangiella sp.]GGF08132.1 threonylcarbamoyl-AMP synthase [Kangiella profundi]